MSTTQRCLLKMVVLLCLPAGAWAQNATITGTVRGRLLAPVVGARVAIPELGLTTATDAAGTYRLSVPAAQAQSTATLRVTYIGYRPIAQRITITPGAQRHDITLVESALALEGVVVTALGVERQERTLGYTVQRVSGADIAQAPVANVIDALAGKTAGVSITSSGGRPGAGSRIVLRGESSFLGNSQPLFVIDGVPVSNDVDALPGFTLNNGQATNRALDIDPNSIGDISVLRGAAATALYGSRAANGAIIITTKRGGGGVRLSVATRYGSDTPILAGFQDTYLQGLNGLFTNGLPLNRGGYVQPGFPGTNPQLNFSWGPHVGQVDPTVLAALGVSSIPTYDPQRVLYRTGHLNENSANVSGSIATGTYYLGATNTAQSGIAQGNSLQRLNVTANITTTVGSRLTSATNAMVTRDNNRYTDEGYYGPQRVLATTPISFNSEQPFFPDGTPRLLSATQPDAAWYLNNQGYASNVSRLIGGQSLAFSLGSALTLGDRIGIDNYTDQRNYHSNQQPWITRPTGSAWDQKLVRNNVNNDLTLTLNERPLGHSVTLSGLLGNNIQTREFSSVYLGGSEINIPSFYNIGNFNKVTGSNSLTRQRLVGAYAQASLGFRNYLFLQLSGRNDWSSTLPQNANSYFYPSASLGFVFTDALGWHNRFIDYGKIRGSWARVGNSAPPYDLSTAYYQAGYTDYQEYQSGVSIAFPYNGVNGYSLSTSLGNPVLKPEMTQETETGLELRLFGGRASTEFTFYDKVTRDEIFAVPSSAATGYTSILRNAGNLRNRGIELSAHGTPIQTRSFTWDLQGNFSKNRSSVISLAPGVTNIYLAGYSYPQIRIQQDAGYGVIWGFAYQRNAQGQVLVDDKGMPLVSRNLSALGNIQPRWIANLRTGFTWHNVNLSGLMDVRRGGDILNFDLYYTAPNGKAKVTENRNDQYVWPGVNAKTGQPNTIPVTRNQAYWTTWATSVQENLVEDGSYVKLREATLSYAVPTRLLSSARVNGLTVYFTGHNLLIDTPFSYGDPEGNTIGSDNAGGSAFHFFNTPTTRNYTFGLRATF